MKIAFTPNDNNWVGLKKRSTWHSKMTCLILIGPSLLKHTGVSFRPTLRIEETEIGLSFLPFFLLIFTAAEKQAKSLWSFLFPTGPLLFSHFSFLINQKHLSLFIYMSLYYVNIVFLGSIRSINCMKLMCLCSKFSLLFLLFFKIFAKLDRFCFVISDPNSVIWDLRQSVQISITIRSEFMSFLNKFYYRVVAGKKVVIEEKLKLWDHISIIC